MEYRPRIPHCNCIVILIWQTRFTEIAVSRKLQGHPERVLKVNPLARALIFTKSGFSGVFWDEK